MSSKNIVLISLIGKGIRADGIKGYKPTEYYFPDTNKTISTAFFGSAVYETLTEQGYNIEKWLIFGTERSNWSDILDAVTETYHDELAELYNRVYDEEEKCISDQLLGEWEDAIKRYIPSVSFKKVDPFDYKIYINEMIREVPDKEVGIVLDITHAFRHMSVVIAFSLMLLKYIKPISNIMLYYGALDMRSFTINGLAPVMKIDFVNDLVSYSENLAVYNNSAYFVDLMDSLGISDTNDIYFRLEMNRQPKEQLRKVVRQLDGISKQDDYKGRIAQYVRKGLEPLVTQSLENRMVNRAKFFFDKKQYLKALVLLYEGFLIALGRREGLNIGLDYEGRRKVSAFIKKKRKNGETIFSDSFQDDIFEKLEYTRNTAVHGSDPRKVQEYVENQPEFEKLFNQALTLYHDNFGGE